MLRIVVACFSKFLFSTFIEIGSILSTSTLFIIQYLRTVLSLILIDLIVQGDLIVQRNSRREKLFIEAEESDGPESRGEMIMNDEVDIILKCALTRQ